MPISTSSLTSWIAILLSSIALLYSRKAYRFQVSSKRKEQVALISIFDARGGFALNNPAGSSLVRAKIYCYDRTSHAIPGTIDFSNEPSFTHRRYSPPLNRSRIVDRYYQPRIRYRPRIEGTEIVLTDASGETWYLNTNGAKRHLPTPGSRRNIKVAILRIGFFWSRMEFPYRYGLTLLAITVVMAIDHYLNSGKFLIWALLALGAKSS